MGGTPYAGAPPALLLLELLLPASIGGTPYGGNAPLLLPPPSIGGTPYAGNAPDAEDAPLDEPPPLDVLGVVSPPPVQAATSAAAEAANTTFARVIRTPSRIVASPTSSGAASLSAPSQNGHVVSVQRTCRAHEPQGRSCFDAMR